MLDTVADVLHNVVGLVAARVFGSKDKLLVRNETLCLDEILETSQNKTLADLAEGAEETDGAVVTRGTLGFPGLGDAYNCGYCPRLWEHVVGHGAIEDESQKHCNDLGRSLKTLLVIPSRPGAFLGWRYVVVHSKNNLLFYD